MDHPKIVIAFRFHVNFYHSHRGDTPDENGFGKDIRIIRQIIDTLDHFNDNGIDVCGTWDSENLFSLESIIPEHCPDIIESWKRRVESGRDEFQIMSYNNGLISAHTAREFEDVMTWSISNEAQSGIQDLFGSYAAIVRPQEMMYTPYHLKAYHQLGLSAISLFNSALPFNAFSNFVPPLSLVERFNPLTLTYPGMEDTLTLLPAYNAGDLVDNISLAKWIKKIRRQQLELDDPVDLLITIDMDADDGFWVGMDYPLVKRFYSSLKGLKGLVESVADLDYVTFSTPGRYLKDHAPVGTLELGQDTADGSFDGLSSWAEKFSSQRLWTGIERSRILELQTKRLMELVGNQAISDDVNTLLDKSYKARIKSLSTTHFGLSAPIINATRLQTAQKLVKSSVDHALKAFGVNEIYYNEAQSADSFTLVDYTRGLNTDYHTYHGFSSRSLAKLRLINIDDRQLETLSLQDETGRAVPSNLVIGYNEFGAKHAQIYFPVEMEANQAKTFRLVQDAKQALSQKIPPIRDTGPSILENSVITCRFDETNNMNGLIFKGNEILTENGFNTSVNYARHRTEINQWQDAQLINKGEGSLAIRRQRSELLLKAAGGKRIEVKRQFKLSEGLPYLYLDMTIKYPITSYQKYSGERAERLEKAWDGSWIEVMPCEMIPTFVGTPRRHLRVWKNNFFGHVSSYRINYGDFSKNSELDAFNNQITNGWVAVSDGETGLLIAQTAESTSSFAFCPMRTRKYGPETVIHLNPLGTYYGKQFKYQTAVSGLGKLAAFMTADHLESFAPSFNGKKQSISLMIAPYEGDEPPQEIQNDAMAFAYPYMLLTKSDLIKEPECRQWKQ